MINIDNMLKLLVLILLLTGCGEDKTNKREKAIALNNEAIQVVNTDFTKSGCEKAVGILQKAFSTDSTCMIAAHNLVTYLSYLERYGEAIDVLNHTQANGDKGQSYFVKGVLLKKQKRETEAANAFRQCIKLSLEEYGKDKNNVSLLFDIAMSRRLIGDSTACGKLRADIEERGEDPTRYEDVIDKVCNTDIDSMVESMWRLGHE